MNFDVGATIGRPFFDGMTMNVGKGQELPRVGRDRPLHMIEIIVQGVFYGNIQNNKR